MDSFASCHRSCYFRSMNTEVTQLNHTSSISEYNRQKHCIKSPTGLFISPYVAVCLACNSWRLCFCMPEDPSGTGPKGATNKPYSQHKALLGGVAGGGGKSTDVHFSFCLLLLSPFPVFNLVNTRCSYNML